MYSSRTNINIFCFAVSEKYLLFCSTWTNRRQHWGRWTTVDWGYTSRFWHLINKIIFSWIQKYYSICIQTAFCILSKSYLMNLFLQQNIFIISHFFLKCLLCAAGDLHCRDGESKQQVGLWHCKSSFSLLYDFLSSFSFDFFLTFTFI